MIVEEMGRGERIDCAHTGLKREDGAYAGGSSGRASILGALSPFTYTSES